MVCGENLLVSLDCLHDYLKGINTKTGTIANWLTGTFSDVITGIRSGVNSLTGTLLNIWDSVIALPITIAANWENFWKVETLNLDGLKNLVIFDKFPFSIPFDLIDTINLFAVSASTPEFDIDINTEYLKVNHTIDLSPYMYYIGFFRYFVVVVFIFFLITKTRDLIKW